MKLHRINALLLKYLYISQNSLDRLFDIIYWPILDIFLWGFTTYYIEGISGVNLLSIFMGGIILWVFVWRSSQDLAVFVLEDFWGRNLYNLFTSPLKASELVFSIVIFALFRGIASFIIQTALAFLLYKFNLFAAINLYYIALLISILITFGWAMGLVITGFIFRYGSRIQVFAWSISWVIQPFSCVFYPLSSLPQWAQDIAVYLPTTHVFEALRAVINHTAINWAGIIYAILITLACVIAASVFLSNSIKFARRTGLLARFE